MPNNAILALRKCTKKVLITRILIVLLIVFNFSFIWHNSAKVSKDSNAVSKNISQDIAEKVVNDFENLSKPTQQKHINKINIKIRSLGHFTEFIPLGLLFFLLMMNIFIIAEHKRALSIFICIVFSLLLSFICALTDETHQLFVKGRSFQLIDIFLDTLGAFVGCVVGLVALFFIRDKSNY